MNNQPEAHPGTQQEQAEAVAAISPLIADAPTGRAEQAADKPSLLAYPATYLLLAINIGVFLLMFTGPVMELVRQHQISQIFTAEFSVDQIVRFGGSSSVLVQQNGQWWRLLTANFVHVTLLHLALNMWCLWNLGLFGEPLLGKPGLVAVYLLTGSAGMLLSLAWSDFLQQPGVVAGASAAVFGIAGILIVLLSNRKLSLPWNELRSLRQSVILFAVLNLAIGIVPRFIPGAVLGPLHLSPDSLPNVDNSAHLGGFVTGLALGAPLFPRMTSGKSSYRSRQLIVFVVAALALCLCCYAVGITFAQNAPTQQP